MESDTLFDTTSSDENGEFSFTTSPLADGDYKFKVQTDSAESEVINITIDSLSANLTDSTITPESPVSGEQFDLSLTFDSEVNSASVIINGVQTNLSASDSSKKRFSASILAPLLPDEYNVSVVIVDMLGKQLNYSVHSSIADGEIIEFNMNNVPIGVYSVIINSEEGLTIRRFTKEWIKVKWRQKGPSDWAFLCLVFN